jgi:hypothetical protein
LKFSSNPVDTVAWDVKINTVAQNRRSWETRMKFLIFVEDRLIEK